MSHSSVKSNLLLEVVSTRGVVTLDEFAAAFDQLIPVEAAENRQWQRRKIMSALDALGHCEVNWAERKIAACSPVLARLPQAGCPLVVLTGARSVALIERIRVCAKERTTTVNFSAVPQVAGLPDIVTLEVSDETILRECARFCNVPLSGTQPAAWILACASPDLLEYEASLTWQPDAPLNWRQRVFDPKAAFFCRDDDPATAPLRNAQPRLSEHINPTTQQRHCRWTKANRYALVERDWGCYLAFHSAGERVLQYDARRHRLAVPSSALLPRLLSRAATLCSGAAASSQASSQLNIYSSVPPGIAELLAKKCGQTLKAAALELENDHD